MEWDVRTRAAHFSLSPSSLLVHTFLPIPTSLPVTLFLSHPSNTQLPSLFPFTTPDNSPPHHLPSISHPISLLFFSLYQTLFWSPFHHQYFTLPLKSSQRNQRFVPLWSFLVLLAPIWQKMP